MALSPTEVSEENLAQLQRLVQSPGWGLFKTRLTKRVASRELAKDQYLREEKHHLATLELGRVEGLREAVEDLFRYIEELTPKHDVDGSY